jgi:hypothetical protein
MKITEKQLRRIIKEELIIVESELKGTLNVKDIASKLGIKDPLPLFSAITKVKSGTDQPLDAKSNAALANVFIKLMNASPEETTQVMNILKKVEKKSEENSDESGKVTKAVGG